VTTQRPTSRSVARWLLVAIGSVATLLAVTVGLSALREWRAEHEADSAERLFGDGPSTPGLKQSKVFTSPLVGYGGERSPVAAEFMRVLGAPSAEDTFVDLVEHGAPGAGLYGICGLSILNSKRLPRYSIATDDREVAMMDGCSMSVTRVQAALQAETYQSICAQLGNPALPGD
jgi:hypothetical protein